MMDEFLAKLPKSGECSLCNTFFKGLKIHARSCYKKRYACTPSLVELPRALELLAGASFDCPSCGKAFKNTKRHENHLKKCRLEATSDWIDAFQFDDELFLEEISLPLSDSSVDSISSDPSDDWLTQLESIGKPACSFFRSYQYKFHI